MRTKEAHDLAYRAVYEHFALQKVPELTLILGLIKPTDRVLEIGCDAGGTTWAIMESGATHFGIDLPGERYSSGLAFAANDTSNMVFGDSHLKETRKKLNDMLPLIPEAPIDILIIDGDHTYSGVQQDFYMYSAFCRGIVIFHDVCEHSDESVGVRKFFEKIKGQYTHLTYEAEPYDWGGLGFIETKKGELAKRIEAMNADSES